MSGPGKISSDPGRRKILVPLDASDESVAALKTAVRLASRMQASLEGLFIEDDNLLRAGELACCQVVHAVTATVSTFDRSDMEHQLRLAARRARAALVAETTEQGLDWSFRVDRGDVTASILAAALDVDLIVMGRTSRRPGQRQRLGSTTRKLVSGATAVLVTGARQHHGPVACMYDASPVADRALEIAIQLSRRDGGRLLVLLAIASSDRTRVAELTKGKGLEVDYEVLPDSHLHGLQTVLRRLPVELLVLPDGFPALAEAGTETIVSTLDVPVLVIGDKG